MEILKLPARLFILLNISLFALAAAPAHACTVFVMNDGDNVLFCNNEDYSNPKTMIWFIPGAERKYGCVYEGFDDGWGQGGFNTEGLAFGWVAGFKEQWETNTKAKAPRGNPTQRMLETCSTVEEATEFFRQFHEPSFSYGKLLVADRTGASAIIGAKDGRLHAEITNRAQGIGHRFGLRGSEAAEMLAEEPEASLASAVRLLRFTLQEGPNATKYSVVYDLKSGEIDLFRFPEQTEAVQFNLAEELKKGPHCYDIPKLREQLSQELRPLTEGMKKY